MPENIKLSEKEQNLVNEVMPRLRATPYGKMTFTVTQQKSQPVLLEIDKAKETVKL